MFRIAFGGLAISFSLMLLPQLSAASLWKFGIVCAAVGAAIFLIAALRAARRSLRLVELEVREVHDALATARSEIEHERQQMAKRIALANRQIAIERGRTAFPDVPIADAIPEPSPGPRKIQMP